MPGPGLGDPGPPPGCTAHSPGGHGHVRFLGLSFCLCHVVMITMVPSNSYSVVGIKCYNSRETLQTRPAPWRVLERWSLTVLLPNVTAPPPHEGRCAISTHRYLPPQDSKPSLTDLGAPLLSMIPGCLLHFELCLPRMSLKDGIHFYFRLFINDVAELFYVH